MGKAWSRSGNTASIVVAPAGGPRAGWTPASQRSALLGAVSFQAWPTLPGENQGCVSQLTRAEVGPGATGLGGRFVGSHPEEQL